jgi:hypothetical protein
MPLAPGGPLGSIGIGVFARGEGSGGGQGGVVVEVHKDDGTGHLSSVRQSDGIAREGLSSVATESIDVVTVIGRHGDHDIQDPIAIHIANSRWLVDPTGEPAVPESNSEGEGGGQGRRPGIPEDIPVNIHTDNITSEISNDHLEIWSPPEISHSDLRLDLVELHREESARESSVPWRRSEWRGRDGTGLPSKT